MNVLSNNISITSGLLIKLRELYPDRIPSGEVTLETLRYLQGQQSVLNKLQELYDDAFEEN